MRFTYRPWKYVSYLLNKSQHKARYPVNTQEMTRLFTCDGMATQNPHPSQERIIFPFSGQHRVFNRSSASLQSLQLPDPWKIHLHVFVRRRSYHTLISIPWIILLMKHWFRTTRLHHLIRRNRERTTTSIASLNARNATQLKRTLLNSSTSHLSRICQIFRGSSSNFTKIILCLLLMNPTEPPFSTWYLKVKTCPGYGAKEVDGSAHVSV